MSGSGKSRQNGILRGSLGNSCDPLVPARNRKARRTGCPRGKFDTLRQRLLQRGGAWIESSIRRMVIHMPAGTPLTNDWCRIACSAGAAAT